MNTGSRGRLAVIASILAAAAAGSASVSAAANRTSCDGRAGKTVLKDTQARVFHRHAVYYACSRTTGRTQQLSGPKSWDDPGDGFELAGPYVAWAQIPSPFKSASLQLLDVDRGSVKTVFPGQEQGEATSSWVESFLLNDQGTVVWLYDGTGGGVADGTPYAFSEVLDSRNHHVLGSAKGTGVEPKPPITSLGLSSDGKFAFWLDNGTPRGAPVPK